MQTIRLPKHLPSSNELTQLNQRLRAGEICLDWRDVTATIQPGQLESLLKDLNLAEHFDNLGIDTVPESLQAAIATTFDDIETQMKHKTKKLPPLSKRKVVIKPEIWLPTAGSDLDNDDINKTIFRIFPESEEQTVLPAMPVSELDEKTVKIPAIKSRTDRQERPEKTATELSPSAQRDLLEMMMLTNLLGPTTDNEIDKIKDDRVREHYLIGLIAPKELSRSLEELDHNSVIEPDSLIDLCLDMRQFAVTALRDLKPLLMPLIATYNAQIYAQQIFARIPDEAIQHCQEERQRIQAGIDLLEEDPAAAQAFIFMNRAMWLQRIHTLAAAEKRQQGLHSIRDLDQAANRSWQPCQLAFMLQNLPALTALKPDANTSTQDIIADPRWLPTDESKTDAYLGLTAYTLIIRRLQGKSAGSSNASGMSVVMRYTSRLLTPQQIQNLAALICACEAIRRPARALWGQTPFRLGLWVGQDAKLATSSHIYHDTQSNPRYLTHCPWCGHEIDHLRDILVEIDEKGREHTFIYCGNREEQCQFARTRSRGEGLPILIVDEEIYRLQPSLLLATAEREDLAFFHRPSSQETLNATH